MMPADFERNDEIGAPTTLPGLCSDHRPVIRAASSMDHIGDEDSVRLAAEYHRQCPQCRRAS